MAGRPFYGSFAWAYDLLSPHRILEECAQVAATLTARGVPGDATLLDAGCGTGRYAVELARRGYRVTGLDAAPELLAVARRRPEAADVTFLESDLLTLPGQPQYGAVLCRGVLNDVVEDAHRLKAFEAFARALARGGVLMLDVRDWEAHRPAEDAGAGARGHGRDGARDAHVPEPDRARPRNTADADRRAARAGPGG